MLAQLQLPSSLQKLVLEEVAKCFFWPCGECYTAEGLQEQLRGPGGRECWEEIGPASDWTEDRDWCFFEGLRSI